MELISFACDRCGSVVDGLVTKFATAGFYFVGSGKAWEQFGRPGESRVCDECVHSMPEYKAVYG